MRAPDEDEPAEIVGYQLLDLTDGTAVAVEPIPDRDFVAVLSNGDLLAIPLAVEASGPISVLEVDVGRADSGGVDQFTVDGGDWLGPDESLAVFGGSGVGGY